MSGKDQKIHDLVIEIVRELGDDWSVANHENYNNEHIVNRERIELSFHNEDYGAKKGYIEISLSEPYELRQRYGYKEHTPSIGVNSTRGAVAIAKEITRRLLPQATALHHTLVERLKEHNAYTNRKINFYKTLAEALGVEFKPESLDRTDQLYVYLKKQISVEINCGDKEATIKLRFVPADVAKMICEMLYREIK